MLRFFARIRQTLVASSSFRRYALYALGEILLVMIGILLALQVNNWNEQRKKKIQEHTILSSLYHTTLLNRDELMLNYRRVSRFLEDGHTVLAMLDRQQILDVDSLLNGALLTGFRVEDRLNMTAFAALENAGLDVLSSDSIKMAIVEFYGTHLPNLYKLGHEWSEYFRDISIEGAKMGALRHYQGYRLGDISLPQNFEFIRSMVSLRIVHKTTALSVLNTTLDHCDRLLRQIESQINSE